MVEIFKEFLRNPAKVDFFSFKAKIDLDKIDKDKLNTILDLNINKDNSLIEERYIKYKNRLIKF